MNDNLQKVGPFSDNPIMIGYDNRLFDFDSELGYVFPKNQIIGGVCFVELESKIDDLKKRDGKFLILNLGDSATSGWNSDNVYTGCPDPTAALFSYKTYSDILENKYGFDVINAGVPGYTTYQAKKYLAKILKTLAQKKMCVDYVTTYFGNNDCTFNGLEDKTRIDNKNPSIDEILARVSEKNFRKNYDELLFIAKEYGATPIILVPASNFNWQPGLRSRKYPEELDLQRQKITRKKIKEFFEKAEQAYRSGDYEMALENDLLLPRIKKSYKSLLKTFTDPLIDTQNFVHDENDFVDYCHPAEIMNERIAEAINKLLKNKNTAYSNKIIKQDLPADTYTLY